jgi:hypothetical protein
MPACRKLASTIFRREKIGSSNDQQKTLKSTNGSETRRIMVKEEVTAR